MPYEAKAAAKALGQFNQPIPWFGKRVGEGAVIVVFRYVAPVDVVRGFWRASGHCDVSFVVSHRLY